MTVIIQVSVSMQVSIRFYFSGTSSQLSTHLPPTPIPSTDSGQLQSVLSVYPTAVACVLHLKPARPHVSDYYAALVRSEKSVYCVCLGTDERASHMMEG